MYIILLLLFAFCSNMVFGQWIDSTVLEPAALLDGDSFGTSVSISDDKLAVGSPADDGAGTDRGIVYTFTWDGNNWVDSTLLAPVALLDSDRFGISVSMSGDKLAVGAYLDGGAGGSNRGIVYTFTWSGSAWIEGTVLEPVGLIDGALFGNALYMSGDKLAIGAHGMNGGNGIVYTYTWDGSNWIDSTVLAPSALVSGDRFGFALTMSGDKLAVGARFDDGAGSDRGIVYTFTWDGSAWVDSTVLAPAALLDGDLFGYALSMDNDKLAVGARNDDGAGSNEGIVYTFTWDGSNWVDSTVLSPAALLANDYFGAAVSLYGDNLAVGAHEDHGAGVDRGIVYTYTWSGSAWVESTVLEPATLTDDGEFGYSLSLDGSKLAVGGRNFNGGGTDRGIVYTFTDGVPTTTSPSTAPTISPTTSPTAGPSTAPTGSPVVPTSGAPTKSPTVAPSSSPTVAPSTAPTGSPVVPTTGAPTTSPTEAPTSSPTVPVTFPPTVSLNNTSVVSKLEIVYEMKDESDNKQVVKDIIDHLVSIYPDGILERTISLTITGALSNALYDIVNNEQLLYDTIKETKCGTAVSYCSITNPAARRRLDMGILENEYQFELVIEIDAAYFDSLDGIDIEDPAFITAVESTLGLSHEETYTVSTVENDVIIQVTLRTEDGDDPVSEDLISDMEFIYSNLTSFIIDIVQTVGINGDKVTSTDLILCPVDRTCNGQGNDLCNPDTGVCDCQYFNNKYWWGIDCETQCECKNGGECKNGLCHCNYPFFGLRCDDIKDCCSTVETYECCTDTDTPSNCGCCTDGKIPVDFDANGTCLSRDNSWCASPAGVDAFSCDILPS